MILYQLERPDFATALTAQFKVRLHESENPEPLVFSMLR